MAEPRGVPRIVKAVIWLIVLAILAFYLLKWIFGLFGAGNDLQRKAVTMVLRPGSAVNISVDGGLMKKTDVAVPLYEGDKISTDSGGTLTLAFFDGTQVKLNQLSEVSIDASTMGKKTSSIALTLGRGEVWVHTPTLQEFSGSIVRTVMTPAIEVSALAHSDSLVGMSSVHVFAAEGLGLPLTVEGNKQQVIVGEGQKLVLPADANIRGDLYVYRSALTAEDNALPFVVVSRAQTAIPGAPVSATRDVIVLTSPQEGMTVDGPTLTVTGNVATSVQKIRINGVAITFDKASASFSEDIMMNEDTFEVSVDALDATNNILSTVKRTVRKATAPTNNNLSVPAFTDPVKTGGTYRTTEKELVIRGTNGGDAQGVLVNDYRLQLFTPGKGTWSYLASADLGNMKVGTNIYNVVAIDANGIKSAAASITIVYDDGTLPPDTGTSSSNDTSTSASTGTGSTPAQVDETTLPQNAPLSPGTLQVTAPAAGMSYTATGGEILVEGTTSKDTATVWVNGYRLQLYKPGVTTWNYIAKEAYGNLKKGTNTYVINARNDKSEIVDTMTYTVTY